MTLSCFRALCPFLCLCCTFILACDPPPPAEATAETATLTFTDVTAPAGLGGFMHVTGAQGQKWFPETIGPGGAFLDYDGDGWLDVALVGGGHWEGASAAPVPAIRLYRNQGDGTFAETTAEAGFAETSAYGFGLAAADYDRDGDTDLFLTTLFENRLYRNDGGRFVDATRGSGLGTTRTWSSSAAFFDADRDGHADLVVGNYVAWTPETDIWCSMDGQAKSYCTPELYEEQTPRFYHNNGDGTFSDWTDRVGMGDVPGKTLAVVTLDHNQDHWPDLVLANDTQRDLLFINRGDGTFEEQGVLSGIAFDENGRARAGMGLDVGDIANDGEPWIFVGNFSKEMIGVYRHVGNGLFIDQAAVSKIGQSSLLTLTFGLFLFDADLDTDLDLLAANGHISEEIERVEDGITFRQHAQLFLNQGQGRFQEAAPGSVLPDDPMVARGTAYADYDRDGDLDVLLLENGGRVRLWRNDLQGGHFLRLTLTGRASNPDGLGAQVVAHAPGLRMERYLRTGASYLSQPDVAATFGLGAYTVLDSLVVTWPNGQQERFTEVSADQALHLVEGSGALESLWTADRSTPLTP